MTTMFETQRRQRGHNFTPPADVRAKVPALYATENIPPAEKVLHVKWFCCGWTWYAAEVDWETGIAFGWVDGTDPEWGYFDLTELESMAVASWIVVERDCYWEPCTFVSLPGGR